MSPITNSLHTGLPCISLDNLFIPSASGPLSLYISAV